MRTESRAVIRPPSGRHAPKSYDRLQLTTTPEARVTWTTDDWATPWPLVNELAAEFGPFDLDPAASTDNAKAPRFYTLEDDGLVQPWQGRVFCNPPFSKVGQFVRKARESAVAGAVVVIVMVVPVRTDMGWWHDDLMPYAEIRYLRGRLRFIGPDGTTIGRPSFASAVAVFRPVAG